eukprot:2424835-Amphidinium_carterae.1
MPRYVSATRKAKRWQVTTSSVVSYRYRPSLAAMWCVVIFQCESWKKDCQSAQLQHQNRNHPEACL